MPIWRPALSKDGGEPVFRQIVQAIADDVQSARLAPETRLPPHRDLADLLGVARGTVARAYREAEALGLVTSRVGAGTVVRRPDDGERAYSSVLSPPTVLGDLTTNVPLTGIDPDPGELFRRLASRPDRRALMRYLPPSGLARHRRAGVQWLERMGAPSAVDEVVLCAGAQHALFVTVAVLASRAPRLYVEELTYPGIVGIAETLRIPLIPIAMDDEGMRPADLARAIRRHGAGVVFVMPTIHNPTGAVMGKARRLAIVEGARGSGSFIVEDAANRMLAPRPPPPFRVLAPERTFLVASVSKVLAPGLRVAFLVGPGAERAALERHVFATQWMVGPIGAEMVAMWLEDGVVDATVAHKRKEAARRQRIAARALAPYRIVAHPSAMHLWLRLPAPWAAERFATEASRRGIVVTPSSAFWTGRAPPPPAVRIALGAMDDPVELERALRHLVALLRLDTPKPLTARRSARRS